MRVMVAEWLQRLLILQDRDARCDSITRNLEGIPIEIAREKEGIVRLKETLSQSESELRAMEIKRLELEGEVEQIEANILKYKTQQLQVKKNEEYTALEKEIDALKDRISELEDTELLLLEQIDRKQAQLEELRQSTEFQISTLEGHIARLKDNYAACESELDEARDGVANAQKEIAPDILQQYLYVKSQLKRPPIVVPLEEGRCQGCHLKVSGEVDSGVRRASELIRCDNCGRILYLDR